MSIDEDHYDYGDRICNCGAAVNKDELCTCMRCGKDTCPHCGTHLTALVCDTVSETIRQYIIKETEHFDKLLQILCPSCLVYYKTQYVLQIPLEHLPLYINEDWGNEKVYQAYRARLASRL